YPKAAVFGQRESTPRPPLGLTCSRPHPVPPAPFPRNIAWQELAANQSYEKRVVVSRVSQRCREPQVLAAYPPHLVQFTNFDPASTPRTHMQQTSPSPSRTFPSEHRLAGARRETVL